MTHICVGKLTIIGSDNGLSPGRRQAIIWTNAGILLIEPKETNFNEIVNEIRTFSYKEMHLNVSSAKRRTFCPGLNMLRCLKSAISKLFVQKLAPDNRSWAPAEFRYDWLFIVSGTDLWRRSLGNRSCWRGSCVNNTSLTRHGTVL